MRCHVPIGKLVSHPCARTTHKRCSRCGKAACDRHRAPSQDCVVCSGDYVPPPAPASVTLDEMFAFRDEELAAFDAQGAARARRLEDLDS